MPEPAAAEPSVHVEHIDGHAVRLRAPHDLSFLARWGSVFRVFDEQDSGNLCFGVDQEGTRLFVKYAGAPTTRYEGLIQDAVRRSRRAVEVYRALRHDTVVALRDATDVASGHVMVFEWTDALSLGRQYGGGTALDGLDPAQRAAAVQQIYDFHVHVAREGWVAVDLYDGSVMVDPRSGAVTLCDLDFYERGSVVNTMGRMWGSRRFMSPEENRLGATIDEVTNVFALGVLAHTLLGNDATRSTHAWLGSPQQLAVATRAHSVARGERWPSIAALADAWRDASA
ncbi:serine/threonine-protein kinase [Microbacterium timonense]|uniref:serine/threonine protein kinase n=1 Tax=Microbacterium timonense TaxID=2086576 RepID=UPI0013599E64|nr:serine/threonine protein kinase [Microbacterium timonense]